MDADPVSPWEWRHRKNWILYFVVFFAARFFAATVGPPEPSVEASTTVPAIDSFAGARPIIMNYS